ncbi:MAG: zinc-ribbon domain-containing protein [Candidatus Accumulibacter sp.]|jgi:predicted Zn finger-like uncharacterized protein|nr:zinc-ribbon domain-containing protein [Accumulibacter sp.]
MKTRCPDCQTVFRVTPEQIRARAGRVRCGYCQAVFDAIDSLVDEARVEPAASPEDFASAADPADLLPEIRIEPEIRDAASEIPLFFPADTPAVQEEEGAEAEESRMLPPFDDAPDERGEPGLAAGRVFPRETSEIHGYSKWAEGFMAPPIVFPVEKPSRRPFWLVAAGLALALAVQVVFHFRGELAVSMPSLRPVLETLSSVFDGPLPLPRHIEQVSIETSDLQTDAARGSLLVLNTTLRNNAPYGQAYPSLELSLTDTQDLVIARRVFSPGDYLPARAAGDPAFPGNSGVAVRLWIETVDIAAAGYRLLVFYP